MTSRLSTAGNLIVAALAGATVLAVPGAAEAATTTISDAAHDGDRLAEITRFTLTNGTSTITATLRYSTFNPARASAFVDLKLGGSAPTAYAAGRKAGGGRFLVRFDAVGGGTYAQVACLGLRVTLLSSPTRVRIVVPQSCLDARGTVTAVGGSESDRTGDLDFTRSVRVARG